MTRKRAVIKILRVNSGILKMLMSLFMDHGPPCQSRPSLLGLARLHLVPYRLLGRRDQFRSAALGFDLFGGRLGEMVRLDGEALAEISLTENSYTIGGALGKAG